ncbi:MAG: hypothetical protein D6737_05590 [Chloroflexi bacterium]|nr:MAG: hypothetical protein D6737_05590 [Chloroflexota bacterium]
MAVKSPFCATAIAANAATKHVRGLSLTRCFAETPTRKMRYNGFMLRVFIGLMLLLALIAFVLVGVILLVPPIVDTGDVLVIASAPRDSRNSDLYLLDTRRSITYRLTHDPAWDGQPAVSPDGRFIAFTSDRDRNAEVYLLRIADGALRRLTHSPTFENSPAWSPDGRYLSYTSTENGNADIFIFDMHDDSIHNLTRRVGEETLSSWSPDGTHIVYVEVRGRQTDLITIDVATRETTALTEDTRFEWNPVWSPTGDVLAFESRRAGLDNVYLLDLTTGALRNFTEDHEEMASFGSWSPDGKRIAYSIGQRAGDMIIIREVASGEIVYTFDTPAFEWAPQWINLRG